MKSPIKTVAISALISFLALCGSVSTAVAETRDAQISQDVTFATYMLAFPKLTSEGGAKHKPLLTPGKQHNEFQACKSTTKNEYFELAIIFNDKLQQLISAFSGNEASTLNGSQLTKITKIK